MEEPVQIDGSYGEGGGQIIRTSLSLAALTGRTLSISNIRAGRGKPGLQAQHLASVRAAAALCDAQLTGDSRGSTYLWFAPRRPVTAGSHTFEISTAGAAPLVAQTVLAPLTQAKAGASVTVTGGTHVPHAPPLEYLEAVYLPALRRAGLSATLAGSAAGFYPRGGGRLTLEVAGGSAPAALDLTERGRLENLRAYIITANLPEHVADRGAAAVEKFMKGIGRPVAVERRDYPSPGQGAAVVLAAQCENGHAGFTGLGERGKPMERVAEAPCEEFLQWWKSGAACDEHLADQLVLPLALSAGESRWTTPVITEHLRTVVWVVRQFLPVEVDLEERSDGSGTVRLRGVATTVG
jgi:RNA 3'-terminal phosphate cyclase (ATP)